MIMDQYIEIKGARVNNLKNVSLKIPRNKFIVIAGVSGSGKSSLAFDTIYAEGPASICRIAFSIRQTISRPYEQARM